MSSFCTCQPCTEQAACIKGALPKLPKLTDDDVLPVNVTLTMERLCSPLRISALCLA